MSGLRLSIRLSQSVGQSRQLGLAGVFSLLFFVLLLLFLDLYVVFCLSVL